jgi:hypothetical protein
MTYEISGKPRKKLKKELSLLKYYRKMIYFYDDIDQVYGLHDNKIEEKVIELDNQIKELEIKLNELDGTS